MSELLSQQALAKIDREIIKYPEDKKCSAIMAALRIAQIECGYLTSEIIEYVAKYLNMPPVRALEVATFYSMYDLKPVGKYKITVCTNLPCALSGAHEALACLKQQLGICPGETTRDNKFTLLEGECMGACGSAPVMLINNHRMCEHMTNDKILTELAELG